MSDRESSSSESWPRDSLEVGVTPKDSFYAEATAHVKVATCRGDGSMAEQHGHEIAPESIEAALKHANISQKHGESIAAVGQKMQNQEGAIADLGQIISERGQSVQQLACESQEYAKIAQDNKSSSTEAYVRSAEAHSKAVEEHVAAVNEYLVATKEVLQHRHAVPEPPEHAAPETPEEDQRSQP